MSRISTVLPLLFVPVLASGDVLSPSDVVHDASQDVVVTVPDATVSGVETSEVATDAGPVPVVVVPDAASSEVKPPENLGDAAKLVVQAVDYGKASKWGLLISAVIMLVVFVFRAFLLKLVKDREVLKWVAFVLSLLAYYGTSLGEGLGFLDAALSVLFYGLPVAGASVGFWELTKSRLPKPSDK